MKQQNNKIQFQHARRIHIIGSVGSGKTTLARYLSSQLNIEHYELDNVVWIRNKHGDIRRTPNERDDMLKKIVQTERWILEGVHYKWLTPSFERADWIIYLDTDCWKRRFRIIKRFVKQKAGLEKANYKPTFKFLKTLLGYNAAFDIKEKQDILNKLMLYKDKLLILNDNKDIKRFLNV